MAYATIVSSPIEVLVRAMDELRDEADVETMVVARSASGELSYFSNLQFISCRIGLLRAHEILQEEDLRLSVRPMKND